MNRLRLSQHTFFLFLFLVVVAFLVYALDPVTLRVSNVTAFSNTQNVSVPLSLENNDTIVGFQLTMNHSDFLVFQDVEAAARMPNAVIETNDTNGQLHIAALIQNNITAGNGTLMNLYFTVAANASAGNYSLLAENLKIADIDVQTFSETSIQGIFTILLDSDQDGIADSSDSCPSTAGCVQFSGCDFGLTTWLPPLFNETLFDLQQDSTLPSKFNATNCQGAFYSDVGVRVRVYNTTLGIDHTYNASGQGNDYVRINSTIGQYHTNINTNSLGIPLGNYTLEALFSNGIIAPIRFELIQNNRGRGRNN